MIFAAGTGILPFMDIIALIAWQNLNGVEKTKLKIVLYVSFKSHRESLGLDLAKQLDSFCKTNGFENFKLHF